MNINKEIKTALGSNLRENVSLAQYTSTEVGGSTRYLIEVDTEESLIEVLKIVIENNIPYLIIGSGTNLLISDETFSGLVIVNRAMDIKIISDKVYVSSGTSLWALVEKVVELGFGGMEKLAGIPGSVGGAIYGNAGAYGQSTSDCLSRVKVFENGKISWIDKENCEFTYRGSIFKKTKAIVIGAEFNLIKNDEKNVEKIMKETLADRAAKYKKNLKCPGSFFKNVEADKVDPKILSRIPKEKIAYGKIPAGYLLESVGAKGLVVGKVKVSDFHSNFFINQGGAKAKDYFELINILKKKVWDKFEIELEPEVQLFNFEKSKKVAVLGLGLEGKDLTNYLLNEGYEVTILDRKEKKELDLEGIDLTKVTLITGPTYLNNLDNFDIVFRSPGFYRYSKELCKAEEKGIVVSSAVKLFFDKCPAKIIGVTGTKGKGTTSSLIYEILKKAGENVFLVGNIGKPYLEILPKLKRNDFVVMEMSSFQLIDLTKSPYVAVVLNITLDHMDWHKDKEEYVEAKTNIVTHQDNNDFAVINADYQTPLAFANKTKAQVYLFSRSKKINGCFVEDGKITINVNKEKIALGNADDLLLKGEHNWENICAASLSGYLLGVNPKVISETIFSFKGLEHRLELVTKAGGITFYNDSFATGPQPTIAAISSFTEPTTVILGGYDKGLDYTEMFEKMANRKNLNIVLIGGLADTFENQLKKKGLTGKMVNLGRSQMDKIVKNALDITPSGGVVILSPAAASFDMFENYKQRGKIFKEAVLKLKNN